MSMLVTCPIVLRHETMYLQNSEIILKDSRDGFQCRSTSKFGLLDVSAMSNSIIDPGVEKFCIDASNHGVEHSCLMDVSKPKQIDQTSGQNLDYTSSQFEYSSMDISNRGLIVHPIIPHVTSDNIVHGNLLCSGQLFIKNKLPVIPMGRFKEAYTLDVLEMRNSKYVQLVHSSLLFSKYQLWTTHIFLQIFDINNCSEYVYLHNDQSYVNMQKTQHYTLLANEEKIDTNFKQVTTTNNLFNNPIYYINEPTIDQIINAFDQCSSSSCEDTLNQNSNYCNFGLLNINSVNDTKFSYLCKFLDNPENIMIAITELTPDSSYLSNLLEHHPQYPILAHEDSPRVGLMYPKYLMDNVQIIDNYNIFQKRSVKSKKVCQCTLYNFSINSINIMIFIVYCAPDANTTSITALFEKITSLSEQYDKFLVLGDFNIDWRKKYTKDLIRDSCGHTLNQIVKNTTRRCIRNYRNRTITTNTIIDLVFLSDKLHEKLGKVCILEDSPSDHFMVKFELDIKPPPKYIIKEFFLDPTKRRPFKKDSLPSILKELSEFYDENKLNEISSLPQNEILSTISNHLKTFLDKHAPMNSNQKQTKKIYRFTASKELRKMIKEKHKLRIDYIYSKRKNKDPIIIACKYQTYKIARKECKTRSRFERNKYFSDKICKEIKNCKDVWQTLKSIDPRHKSTVESNILEIEGKTGVDLAEHMGSFFKDRAVLIPDEVALENYQYIPYPKKTSLKLLEINDDITYDVEQLFKSKKKPSIACGIDTISHKVISQLMPVLKIPLQIAIDKPLLSLGDITTYFNRLVPKPVDKKSKVKNIDSKILKQVPKEKKKLTEKSQRPIADLNIIPKYGCIKVFIDQMRNLLTPLMNNNQFAFPGKGSQLAIVNVLDTAANFSASKKPVLIALWDFSNAFCTTIEEITLKILEKFNISDRIMKLFKEFLHQTFSITKINDKTGFYQSSLMNTGRGNPQGQIGSDFIFALVNDGIEPVQVIDELIERFKYVDDFTDIMTYENPEILFQSLHSNLEILKKTSASVGLQLNDDKTQILPLNINTDDLDDSFKYKSEGELLGFGFSLRPSKKSFDQITGDPACDYCIKRLNSACKIIRSFSKVNNNTHLRVEAASNLIFSNCYDIGLIYAYCSPAKFKRVEISIRKIVRSCGFDRATPSKILHQISTKMLPVHMAIKQIIQLGLKLVSTDDIKKNRYQYRQKPDKFNAPFNKVFCQEFNKLPFELRKLIITIYDVKDRKSMDKIKVNLRKYFRKLSFPDGPLKNNITKQIFVKYRYINNNKYTSKTQINSHKFEYTSQKRKTYDSNLTCIPNCKKRKIDISAKAKRKRTMYLNKKPSLNSNERSNESEIILETSCKRIKRKINTIPPLYDQDKQAKDPRPQPAPPVPTQLEAEKAADLTLVVLPDLTVASIGKDDWQRAANITKTSFRIHKILNHSNKLPGKDQLPDYSNLKHVICDFNFLPFFSDGSISINSTGRGHLMDHYQKVVAVINHITDFIKMLKTKYPSCKSVGFVIDSHADVILRDALFHRGNKLDTFRNPEQVDGSDYFQLALNLLRPPGFSVFPFFFPKPRRS